MAMENASPMMLDEHLIYHHVYVDDRIFHCHVRENQRSNIRSLLLQSKLISSNSKVMVIYQGIGLLGIDVLFAIG